MSRNLARTSCRRCDGKVIVTGPRYVLPNDHFACPAMTVADAECQRCRARYTAWIGYTVLTPVGQYGSREVDKELVREHGFFDLSFRSTFNDEPGDDDMPPYQPNAETNQDIARQLHWHLFNSDRNEDNYFIVDPNKPSENVPGTADFDGLLPLVEIVRFVREAITKEQKP